MMALGFLFVFIVYLIISILVVRYFVKVARKRNIKGWKFGVPAALIMYSFVFWDHVPTLVLHKYYCATEAGLFIYKSPEQWIIENNNIIDSITWKKRGSGPFADIPDGVTDKDGVYRQILNERFKRETRSVKKSMLPITIRKTEITDYVVDMVVVKMTVVDSGYGGLGAGTGINSWKIWVNPGLCTTGSDDFKEIYIKYHKIGREL
ncbi:MAG: hypothetical protein ROD09_11900 [Candidatus Sedimenticola sp. (ex Thyasira tokunagai)]